ncbi:hypothetical protein NX059_009867 [Plenodomus lindquistii]|nr:hypothetical protein NX059_009867 [Plenodomus lindquistii]
MFATRLVHALLGATSIISIASGAAIDNDAVYKRQDTWPASIADDAHDQSWPEFASRTERWSTYSAPTFNEVFLPQNEEELSQGLKYLSTINRPFLAKSGGHGYSATLGSVQNATMINMGGFNSIKLNPDQSVTYGSGILYGELVQFLYDHGRVVTVGSCPCVGSTGAVLGGGLGRFEGLYGLTSDNVSKVRYALYNGTIVEASPKVNNDLFWGIRGAGQNFGIAFEITLQTHPATNNGQHYNGDFYFARKDMKKMFDAVNKLAAPKGNPDAFDPRLNMIPFVSYNTTTQEIDVVLNVQYAGPTKDAQKHTNQFKSYATRFAEVETSWPGTFNAAVGGLINFSCTKGINYDMRGVITKTLDTGIINDFADDLVKMIHANPSANASMLMIETFANQAMNKFPDDFSAFPHRGKFNNMIELVMLYTDEKEAAAVEAFSVKWRNKWAKKKYSGYDKLYEYQNYGHGDEPLSALYGYDNWRHVKLTDLKNKYDPKGLFDGYHAIPKTLAGWT